MNQSESTIYQAIQHAKEGNPNEMQNTLDLAISDKVSDAINLKKIAIAGNLFNGVSEEEEDVEENYYGGPGKGARMYDSSSSSDTLGFNDADKLGRKKASEIDNHARRHPNYGKGTAGDDERIRHKSARALGHI